jgi:hypothetical protein
VRVRWWDARATSYREAAMLSAAEASALPEVAIPGHARIPLDDRLVFFGHYWLTGDIALQSPRHACVDYSAGNGGPLVAYRYDGESELAQEKVRVGGLSVKLNVTRQKRIRGRLLGGAFGEPSHCRSMSTH